MSDELITTNEFLYYADYFTLAAQSGVLSSQSMQRAIAASLNSDPTTFAPESARDVVSERSTLLVNLQQSYSEILTEAITLEPMRDAFVELANHIRKWTGGTIEEYLAANGLTVPSTFAQISSIIGSPISDSYIS